MRMNRTIRIGLALIGIGLLALLLFFVIVPVIGALFSRSPEPVAENTPADGTTPVSTEARGIRVVAREAIPAKSIITEEMLTTTEAPVEGAEDDFVSDPEAVINYITREVSIPEGQPIRKSDLLGHITKVGVAGLVRSGERAIVIPLNQPALHDLIKTGDYVDVIAAFEMQEANTIVRGVRVLAVDVFGKDYPPVSLAQRNAYRHPPAQGDINAVPTPTPTADPNAPPGAAAPAPAAEERDEDAPPPASALTLEVTPEEATRISLAQAANARIDFVLIPREEVLLAGADEPIAVADGMTQSGEAFATATITTAASTILPEVAPYAVRMRRQGATGGAPSGAQTGGATTRVASGNGGVSPRPRPEPIYGSPPLGPVERVDTGMPPAAPGTGSVEQEPVAPSAPPPPATYQIKIIPDGKEPRYETVLKPAE